MKNLLCFFVLFFTSFFIQAQEIKGTVVDSDNFPVPNVQVTVINSNQSALTDLDGNFTIQAAIGDPVLFSMITYQKQTVKATTLMKVTLRAEQLEEVVVIGYGTRKKGSITGSVAQVKSEDIVRTPAQSAIQSIQGKAAGINIVTNDEPGAVPSVTIRGLGTVLGARNPLYVIDGVESGSLNGISPNDIETIDILKDASSTAIYGQKGVNGVIFVTTKKGKNGKVKITYDGYYGQKHILNKVKMSDSYLFAYYNNTALGSSTYFNFEQPVNTDWLEEITRTGEVTSNSVSMSGGNNMVTYYLGISQYEEKGILLGTEFNRTNLVNKNEYKFSDKFKITQFIGLTVANNTPKPLSAFTNAYKQSPIVPVRYENGRFGVPFVNTATGLNDMTGIRYNNVGNPVAQLFNTHEKNKNITLFGSINAEWKVLNDIKFNTNFAATADWGKGYSFVPNRDIWLAQNPSLNEIDYLQTEGNAPNNTLEQRRGDSYEWNWDNYFTYKKQFGNHDITAVLGMSRTTKSNFEELTAKRYNVPEQSNYWYLDFSDDNGEAVPGSIITNKHSTPFVSIAYFARLEYEYNNKYVLTASVRREGISSFQSSQRWGIFPGISAGWIISNEDFIKNVKFINSLKFRAGYGELANGNGTSYNNVAFLGAGYSFGNVPVIQPGTYVGNAVDPNLSWETMREIDLGIDFTMMDNHLSGTLDYYNRKNDNLILPVSPPPVLSENPTYVNAGAITNIGLEVSLRWDDTIGENIKYWIGGNFANNKNKVAEITNPYFRNFVGSGSTDNGEYTKLVVEGQPLGSFYVFDQIGYNGDGDPVLNDMVDGIAGLSDKDRINAGSYIPTYTYALNFGLTYKDFDFSVDTYGVGGNKVYNGKKAQRFGGENVESAVLDNFWTPSNPNASNPKPSNNVPRPSTYFIEDGAFLRINNITIGYTLPKVFDKLQKVRIYATAVNPFIFTKYSGYSPELVGNNNGDPLTKAGIELDAYPTNKTYAIGVNISF